MPRKPGEKYLKAKQQENKKRYDAEYDKIRGNAHQRGYDSRWVKVRDNKLKDNPLCEQCEKEGRITIAEEIHHIIPIDQGGDLYDYNNLMSLCHKCHMTIHANINHKDR